MHISTGDNNIDIGNDGDSRDSDTIRIGFNQNAVYIAGIDSPILSGSAVYIDPTGRLGILTSSGRFKDAIEPMDKASEAILALQPVTFHYKTDTTDTRQFGLIAEEVAKVNPDLVVRDRNGEIYTVRYDAVNAMLLNEFLKEHRKVEALQEGLAQQQKDFQAIAAEQQKQIEALSAGLQKVSAQLVTASPSAGGLETNKPAPPIVLNRK